MRVPSATYRLQFNSAFRFSDAHRLLDYLNDLGVTDIYASPLMKSRKGSVHGYDVTDPDDINPEIGTNEEFEQFATTLHAKQLGLIFDIVPNHMAASAENPWWRDVLAKGKASRYATYFDIQWTDGQVLLPILGKPYGECLESGELRVEGNTLRYFEHEFPLRGSVSANATVDELDDVIAQQPYRLFYWRKAFDQINYRRFFDINDLVALRVERDDVFEATHRTLFDFVKRGMVDGIRVDHIDGLLDPKSYLDRLPDVYVVVEKILGADETLPSDWKTHGTTGYDFLNILNGALIDNRGYAELQLTYSAFTGRHTNAIEEFRARKRQVIGELFGGELLALTDRLSEIANHHRFARDLPNRDIREALVSVTACLNVYRTYIRDFTISEPDRRTIETALQASRYRDADLKSPQALEFLREVLLLTPPPYLQEHRSEYLDFVIRWQQFTGPVMAKGLEDTTFYVHNPLISTNEVGGDPRGAGHLGVTEFHRRNIVRLARTPLTMNATSTHDTKRSEDVRARIDVLSEMPHDWGRCLKRWRRWNPSDSAPDANEQVFIYQTLIGAWPITRERLQQYIVKALREAKTHTTWLETDSGYEQSVLTFVDRILDPHRSQQFLMDFVRFQRRIAHFGAVNSLSQTVLKVTSPGVPDLYQGSELWDYSVADPDNRRPVDFEARLATLDRLKQDADPKDLLLHWDDGRIKMFVIWKALNYRRDNIELFRRGQYLPVEVRGKRAHNVIAFARRLENSWAIVVVPRLSSQLSRPGIFPVGSTVWSNTTLVPPADCPSQLLNVFTGAPTDPTLLSGILSDLPVAILASKTD